MRAPAGGAETPRISHSHAQVVQRAGHSLSTLLQDVGIDHRRSQIAVSEKLLDGPDVRAALQKMCGEGMPKRVGTDFFGEARPPPACFDGLVDDAGIDVVAARDARAWIHRQLAGRKQVLPTPFFASLRKFPREPCMPRAGPPRMKMAFPLNKGGGAERLGVVLLRFVKQVNTTP